MTWTRLDDRWCDDEVFEEMDYEAHWHYLCMLQYCSRNEKYTGLLSMINVRKASDGADHERTLAILIDAGLVRNVDGATFEMVRIKQHVPSPELLDKLQQDKERAARYRKHKAGDHAECSPTRCKEAPSRDASGSPSRDARDGDGTGRAVTGSTTPPPS